MKPRISMITLGVSDLERARIFYRDGLGLPEFPSSGDIAFFDLTGTWLGLYGRKALAQDAAVDDDADKGDTGFPGVTLAHNLASRGEVDALYAEALAAGATATKRPAPTSWGGYSGYFQDPEGHFWEVAHNPHFWIGPPD